MSGSKKKKSDVRIVFNNGETFVSGAVSAYYRYKRWILRINPKLILPGFRKDHRKIIYVDGKKFGKGEFRQGCIPFYPYLDDSQGIGFTVINWIRVHLGLLCRKSDRGYFYVKLGRQAYIIVRRYTEESNIFCKIYHKPTGDVLGSFIFDKDFLNVYPYWSVDNWVRSMFIVMGYVADAVIYSTVASQLNREIDVIVS